MAALIPYSEITFIQISVFQITQVCLILMIIAFAFQSFSNIIPKFIFMKIEIYSQFVFLLKVRLEFKSFIPNLR